MNKKLFVIFCILITNHFMLISQLDTIVNGFKLINNASNVNNINKPYHSMYHFYKFNDFYKFNSTKNNTISINYLSKFFPNDNNFSFKSFNNFNYQQKENIFPALNKILNEYSDSGHPYFSKTEEFNRNYTYKKNLYSYKNGYFLSASGTDPRYIYTNGYYNYDNDMFLIPWIFFLISDIKQNHDSNYGHGNK